MLATIIQNLKITIFFLLLKNYLFVKGAKALLTQQALDKPYPDKFRVIKQK